MYGEKIPREQQGTSRAKSAPASRLSSLPRSTCSTPFSSRPSTARSLKVNPAHIIRRPQTSLSEVSRYPSRAKTSSSGRASGQSREKIKARRPVSSFVPTCVDSDDVNEAHNVKFVSKKIPRVPSAKTAAIGRAVIAARSVTSANAKHSQVTPEQAWITTQPMSQKRQQLKENLMEINAMKVNKVENRMRDFLAKYPLVVKF